MVVATSVVVGFFFHSTGNKNEKMVPLPLLLQVS